MRNDIHYALRTLLRERGFSTMVVLSLAVGIGANTAIFSVVNGVLLRPLPYRDPERLTSARVSANIFQVLGVNPQRGRGFLLEEEPEGHDNVVVISASLWKRRFRSDPAMVGRKIVLNGAPSLVAGVLPAGFQFPGVEDQPDVFKPLGYSK